VKCVCLNPHNHTCEYSSNVLMSKLNEFLNITAVITDKPTKNILEDVPMIKDQKENRVDSMVGSIEESPTPDVGNT
jgi:hypothetical protein